jgi:hypothetical protein
VTAAVLSTQAEHDAERRKLREVISSLRLLLATQEQNGPAAYEVTVQRARRILRRAPKEEENNG